MLVLNEGVGRRRLHVDRKVTLAESPDEAALVVAAKVRGSVDRARKSDAMRWRWWRQETGQQAVL